MQKLYIFMHYAIFGRPNFVLLKSCEKITKTHFLATKTYYMHKEIIFPKNNCSTQPKIHRRSLKNNH